MKCADVFASRRQRLLEAIHPGLLVVFSAPSVLRNNDVEHPYRQSSDFHYLSGFDEPDSVLVLSSVGKDRFVLFVPERDPEREVWDGPRAGVEGAMSTYGASRAFPIGKLDEELPKLLENVPSIHYRLGEDRSADERILRAVKRVRRRARAGVECPTAFIDPLGTLHEQRLHKASDEIQKMREAARITCEAHVLAMRAARPGVLEYQLEGVIAAHFAQAGARRVAYSSIVGSGPNATTLHHVKNDRELRSGELVLIDAGCEYDYYAADVTRTFPVDGRFSEPQRRVYEVVLTAQLAALQATLPGATLEEVHRVAVASITSGLIDLGLVEGPLEEAIEKERYKPYYMHRTGHFLGMDVHDVGAYQIGGKARPLEAGMVITVEPGIYIREDAKVNEEYRGIGVRIEDDVLLTESGLEVLTAAAPKTIDGIEQACQG